MNKQHATAKIARPHASGFRAEYAHHIINLLNGAIVTESIRQVL